VHLGFLTRGLAQAQSQLLNEQLDAGTRYLDLSYECAEWTPGIPWVTLCKDDPYSANLDYYNHHGIAISKSTMLE
jgi:hypothetical protein